MRFQQGTSGVINTDNGIHMGDECRIASEAEAEAARLAPAAEGAVAAAWGAAAALRGAAQELSVAHLHSLAASRLQAWLRDHGGAADFQVRSWGPALGWA